MIESNFTLHDVDAMSRRGIGNIYKAVITIDGLYRALKKGFVNYAPKYQRGFDDKMIDVPDKAFESLYYLNDERLKIKEARAEEMAVKFLQGKLYDVGLTWNIRLERDSNPPIYDKETRTLKVDGNITIPDSGHRHKTYYKLGEWYYDVDRIPDYVKVDGMKIPKETIVELMEDFNPKEEIAGFIEIFNLSPQSEGILYDERNTQQVKISANTAIDVNPEKTPSRRFVYQLMKTCPIFHRDELELRSNSIGTKSRKLTTIATLEAAIRPKVNKLIDLEQSPEVYNDMISFYCQFFNEWSYHYPQFKPGTSSEDRWDLRETSFALSNIMFYPLMEIAFKVWMTYNKNAIDWTHNDLWKELIGKLNSKVELDKNKLVPLMSRENTNWRGKILVGSTDSEGNTTWGLSSTNTTRKAAFKYLSNVIGLDTFESRLLND